MKNETKKPALLVLNDPWAMRINKELAREIGFENSIVLLQLEFLIRQANNFINGRWWTYQSLTDLSHHFPWWSQPTISRILKDLLAKKLITIDNFNRTKLDRTQWFALNEEGISKLKTVQLAGEVVNAPIFHFEKCILQNEKCISSNCKMHSKEMKNACDQIETTIPEILPEITKTEIKEEEKKEEIHVSHSLDNLAVVSNSEFANHPVEESQTVTAQTEPKTPLASNKSPTALETNIVEVFEHWKQVMGKRANCTITKGDKYWKAIEARLREGFTVEELKQAVNGCARSPFYMGLNDKNKKYNCLTVICRDKAKVEDFIEEELQATESKITPKELTYEPTKREKPSSADTVEEAKRIRRARFAAEESQS